MDQPLADAVGNATEVREAIEVLRGEREGRFTDLCVALAGHMAALTGVAEDPDAGREAAIEALANGDALERFRRFVAAQGGDADIVDDPSRLPQPAVTRDVTAGRAGVLATVDAEAIGRAAATVGAGRLRKEDEIDLAVGIDFLVRIGDRVDDDTVIARVLAADDDAAGQAGDALREALTWSDDAVDAPPLIHAVVS